MGDLSHSFFWNLHIREDNLLLFEAGSWSGGGFLGGTVAVRLHDLQGKPIAATLAGGWTRRRSCGGASGSGRQPSRSPAPLELAPRPT